MGSPKPLHETDDESLDHFLGLMLRAPFRLARDVLPHMHPGSAIINITSTFAVVGGCAGCLLCGQGRPDGADHPHRLPIRFTWHPV
ncbi:putative 2-(R)-hydroxypropyl-CoM dehydrogenase [Mycobacterium xenopi 3993]|nr:putative 2-(R)-hydroxypropyl-CoM dehydrogenase [Mycobacterium xenopi 3993]